MDKESEQGEQESESQRRRSLVTQLLLPYIRSGVGTVGKLRPRGQWRRPLTILAAKHDGQQTRHDMTLVRSAVSFPTSDWGGR